MRIIKGLKRNGIVQSFQYILHHVSEYRHERYFSADTEGDVMLADTGIIDKDALDYGAVPYAAILNVLKEFLPTKDLGTFVDYGCGKGRVLLCAGLYQFEKIIGVELSQELADIARKNITRARHKLICNNIDILGENATKFNVPDDATVVHFNSPFRNNTLKIVMENLRASLEASPRELLILYCNAGAFEKLLEEKEDPVIPEGWIRNTNTVVWPHFQPSRDFMYGNAYRIYRILPF
jgi:predicted RNA methylase